MGNKTKTLEGEEVAHLCLLEMSLEGMASDSIMAVAGMAEAGLVVAAAEKDAEKKDMVEETGPGTATAGSGKETGTGEVKAGQRTAETGPGKV